MIDRIKNLFLNLSPTAILLFGFGTYISVYSNTLDVLKFYLPFLFFWLLINIYYYKKNKDGFITSWIGTVIIFALLIFFT